MCQMKIDSSKESEIILLFSEEILKGIIKVRTLRAIAMALTPYKSEVSMFSSHPTN